MRILFLTLGIFYLVHSSASSRVLEKFLNQCTDKDDELLKCLKIQGVDVVSNSRQGRSDNFSFNERKLEKLSDNDLNDLIRNRAARFLDTHKIQVNIPKIIDKTARSLQEGGRKGGEGGGGGGGGGKDKGSGYGALLAALAIKGTFLAMAYKGIAIMSGTAILVGKMALVLSAILGLKKLISGNQEKTTFEIIKTPKYTEEHVHSSTYEDDHDHYRRNYLEPSEIHKRVFRIHIPEH